MENKEMTEAQKSVLEQLKSGAVSSEQMDFVANLLSSLKTDLINSFARLAKQYETTEDKIQLALRFRDVADNTGELYYQVMVNWKPVREANFNRDFLGQEGAAALFPDESGKENFIRMYVLGFEPLHIEGALEKVANQHNVAKWSFLSGIFHKSVKTGAIKFSTYVVKEGRNEVVMTIDIFSEDAGGIAVQDGHAAKAIDERAKGIEEIFSGDKTVQSGQMPEPIIKE